MKEKVYSFLIVLVLLASLTPAVYEIGSRDRLQPNRTFELVHNFPTDYNFYLSRIRQGIEGRMTVIEQYTSEPHTGSFLHVFYLALGWFGRWNRVPWERGGDVYHVARVVFGVLLLVMIAEFCKKSFSDFDRGASRGSPFDSPRQGPTDSSPSGLGAKAVTGLEKTRRAAPFLFPLDFSLITHHSSLIAFLLAVTASTWPKLVAYVSNQVVPPTFVNISSWRFGGYMPWWSVMDSLQRITFIPHLLIGQTLILFLIMALSDRDTMRKLRNWVFLGILAFTLGIIFPPGLLFVIAAVALLQLLEVLYSVKGVNIFAAARLLPPTSLIPRLVVLGLGVPSLLYLSLMTSFYPWKRLAEFDIVKPLPFEYAEYLKAVGPILPIGVIGLVVAFLMRERRMLPAASWVIAWAVLLITFRFIPQQSPLRFSEMTPHVPLAVLTTYLFYTLYNRYKNYTYHIFLFPVVLIAVGIGVMYSSFLWQRDFIDHKMRATYPLVPTGSYVMYPLRDFLRAMKYIQDATSRDAVILSETTAGNYLPVMSGNTVYVGHANTVNAEGKEVSVKEFFSGRMNPDEAKQWLASENLSWIFFGPQEKEDGGVSDLAKIYPFLQQAHKNTFVTIYRLP